MTNDQAADPINVFGQILRLLGNLNQNGVESGVPSLAEKNVNPAANSALPGKKSARIIPNLIGDEKRRVYNTGLELFRAFFALEKKNKPDIKPGTLIAQTKEKVANRAESTLSRVSREMDGFLGDILTSAKVLAGTWFGLKAIGLDPSTTIRTSKLSILIAKQLKVGEILKNFGSKIVNRITGFFASAGDDIAKAATIPGVGKGFGEVIRDSLRVLVSSKLGTGTKFLGRILPGVGLLLSGGMAVNFFRKGKWFRGIVEIFNFAGNLMTMTGVGATIGVPLQIASLGVGLLMDIFEKKEVTGSSVASGAKFAVKYGAGILGKLIPNFLKPAKLLKFLKNIPFLGGLIGIGFAVSRFKKGEWFLGLLELVSGFARSIPFAGTALGVMIDGGLLIHDINKAPAKDDKKPGIMSRGWSWVKNIGGKIWEKVKNFSFFKGFLKIGEGIRDIFSGNMLQGLGSLFSGLLSINPLAAPLVTAFTWISGLFSSKDEEKEKQSLPGKISNIFAEISDAIVERLKAYAKTVYNIIRHPIKTIRKFFGWGKSDTPEENTANNNTSLERARAAIKAEQEAIKVEQEKIKNKSEKIRSEMRIALLSEVEKNIGAPNAGKKIAYGMIHKYMSVAKQMMKDTFITPLQAKMQETYKASTPPVLTNNVNETDLHIRNQSKLIDTKNRELEQKISTIVTSLNNSNAINQIGELTDVNQQQANILSELLYVQKMQLNETRKVKPQNNEVATVVAPPLPKTPSSSPVTQKPGNISMYGSSPYSLGTA